VIVNVHEIIAIAIGVIQGMVFIPTVLLLPEMIVERMIKWRGKPLPFWRYIITLNGIFFIIIVFFGIGWVWMDMLSSDGNRSHLLRLWGKSWFGGMILSIAIGIIEEEISKKK